MRAVVDDCEVRWRDGAHCDGHRDNVEVVPRMPSHRVIQDGAGYWIFKTPVAL